MKCSWIYSHESEAKRLIHIAHQISNYFYQVNGFSVIPHEVKPLPDNAVIFPDLPYQKINRFFEKARKININNPIQGDTPIAKDLIELLRESDIPHLQDERSARLQKDWNTNCKKILTCISHIIPDTCTLLKTITVHPTRFGARQSFNRLSEHKNDLAIYVRFDATVGTITESIVSALTRQFMFDNLSATWSEAEIVPDWLVTQSKLSKVINAKFIPTLNSIRGVESTKIAKVSSDYLEKLGFPHTKPRIDLNGSISLNGKSLMGLTEVQDKVLRKLLAQGKLETDELADIIFRNEDDYSLYAMAKFIQRLRNKLEANGLTGSVIQTVRGFGYTMRSN